MLDFLTIFMSSMWDAVGHKLLQKVMNDNTIFAASVHAEINCITVSTDKQLTVIKCENFLISALNSSFAFEAIYTCVYHIIQKSITLKKCISTD